MGHFCAEFACFPCAFVIHQSKNLRLRLLDDPKIARLRGCLSFCGVKDGRSVKLGLAAGPCDGNLDEVFQLNG